MNSLLCQEPDLLTKIFILLPISDVCNAELVCTYWRYFIVEHKVWKHKLVDKWNSNYFWKNILQQHDWNIYEPSHEVNKRLCLQLAVIIPDRMSDKILRNVRKDSHLNDIALSKKYESLIERSFVAQLHNDRNKIISKIPKRPWGRIGWRRGPRKITFVMDQESDDNLDTNSLKNFSKLLLLSPAAFPILVSRTNKEDIILAGARYGKGRVIVASHHNVLYNSDLIQV